MTSNDFFASPGSHNKIRGEYSVINTEDFFKANKERWYIVLDKIEQFIGKKKCRPHCHSKNINGKKLAT